MVFSSLIFLFMFLPITLILYYISPRYLKNLILLISSLIFYAWGEPVYIILMLFSIITMFFFAKIIDKNRENRVLFNILFALAVMICLGSLVFFKYYGFIVINLNMIFSLNLSTFELPLPIGISFYTFQILSYIVDVYRGKVEVQNKIISFAMYVTMFPQLIAGPIVRYSDVLNEIDTRKESMLLFGQGVERFINGLIKKVLLANYIGLLWNTVKTTSIAEISIFESWLGIIAFFFQIYFDFSGYSDMAIGLGKMFGFNFKENFNYPYISKSVTEFWRRWHMSLGTWFKEYVYIPLGGNKYGLKKQCRNLIIVWTLTGIWHGANWNFLIWGLYFGIFIVVEKLWLLERLQKLPSFITHTYVLIIVIVGWVFFEFENLRNAFEYLKIMSGLSGNKLISDNAIYLFYTNIIVFIFVILASTPIFKKIKEIILAKENLYFNLGIIIFYSISLLLCTASLVNESYNPFLYFKF
ncbi:MBOAT family O-acyltransferase [Clostridium grantii]|uniref:Alginate O-acetyltransferase complex protein AlgI n=1 Tax=Clostridium grantii DSM 8605 TaxID=1121316 RepID=A0A1M5XAJ6_9CLOT|nr:MBOAT family O-acyltransferase [Clostridium grantii]SHH96806.1 alginate O-acetyltransferase complex protein AlgI [Clostridium grantii DSM 8605]